jgi:hypothetical protein
MLLTTIGSGINMLFSLRDPSIYISTFVIQLVAYPIGLGWDLVMPDHEFTTFGLKWNLKPGKFNMKEHTIIGLSAVSKWRGMLANETQWSWLTPPMETGLLIPLILLWHSRSGTTRTSVGGLHYYTQSPLK